MKESTGLYGVAVFDTRGKLSFVAGGLNKPTADAFAASVISHPSTSRVSVTPDTKLFHRGCR